MGNGPGSHYSHAGCDPELWASSPKLSYTWQSCGPLRKRNTQANVHPNRHSPQGHRPPSQVLHRQSSTGGGAQLHSRSAPVVVIAAHFRRTLPFNALACTVASGCVQCLVQYPCGTVPRTVSMVAAVASSVSIVALSRELGVPCIPGVSGCRECL